MPELPEVETVMRGLMPAMAGKRIERANIRRAGLRWPFPPRMAERLEGAVVRGFARRSKYILVELDTDESLLIHLGMSGRMKITHPSQAPAQTPGQFYQAHCAPAKHDHVILEMADATCVTFNDARRFGAMDLIQTQDLPNHKLLRHLGPEPLGNSFSETYLAQVLAGKNIPIKAALLDQRIVAGLGNIYVCEVLHRTGISPLRKAGRISRKRVASLVPAIRNILAEAIESGGSSLRDHRQTNGDLGYFQHRFAVYDQEGASCVSHGCRGKIQRIMQSGRSSFYCNKCQR